MDGCQWALRRCGPIDREFVAWQTPCGVDGVDVLTPFVVDDILHADFYVTLASSPARAYGVGDIVYWRPHNGCKIYLDDERTPPPGWLLVRWPDEVITLLQAGGVSAVSLDHDLGDDDRGTGNDVILWLEEAVITRGFVAPELHVHSANVAGRKKMALGIESIRRWSS